MCLNSKKTSSRSFKIGSLGSKNNKKRFLGKATSHNDHYLINMGGQKSKTGGNWTLTVDNFSNKLFNKYFSLFQSTCQFKVSARKQATVIFIILTYYDIKSD